VAGYWALPGRLRPWWLLGASLLFYASWNAAYVPGFLVLIAINWWLGLQATGPHRRAALIAAVVIDLAVLVLFKYLDWVIGSGASAFRMVTGEPVELGAFGLILPLAISFVTFTFLGYAVDVYRGTPPERDPLRFSVFVLFFPHLIAGPILRGHELLPQLRDPRPLRSDDAREAGPRILGGLVKKSIADLLAPSVAAAYADPAAHSTFGLFVATVAFTFQLYLDFSGYTDIALGSAQLMGFKLPRNFDWPYRATNMADFWTRWHMTLGRWLRDYVYFPLGGSRHGPVRTYSAVMVTMVLCGLWHGAGFTYLVWGFLQGVALCAYRWWRRRDGWHLPLPAAWAVTFAFVLLVRVFFGAESLSAAFEYLRELFTLHDGIAPAGWLVALCALLLVGQAPAVERAVRRLVPVGSPQRSAAYGAAAVLVIVLLPVTAPAFIYFQF
jgi:alginate O-acetyltransferase complex protein AlgI